MRGFPFVRGSLFKVCPAFERLFYGYLVGKIEVRTDGQAHGQPGQFQRKISQDLGDVERGCFSLRRGVGGDDDFFEAAALDPPDELLELEFIGAYSLKRRERPQEDVVA